MHTTATFLLAAPHHEPRNMLLLIMAIAAAGIFFGMLLIGHHELGGLGITLLVGGIFIAVVVGMLSVIFDPASSFWLWLLLLLGCAVVGVLAVLIGMGSAWVSSKTYKLSGYRIGKPRGHGH